MKLLCCAICGDLIVLKKRLRHCQCRRSEGKYLSDALHAIVNGPCSVLGIDNHSLALAMINRNEDAAFRRQVDCWVIDESLPDCHVIRGMKGKEVKT